ncbi:hypothetical protein LTR97_012205 [Elasticomyces elasticus]|uniref:6-methylsalicylate decarboxylase n=1 Tax=Elasticomyces elasticus TaxID=574655 RepID=A0AAN7VZD8_9PEZI|nr:hypothetical protein LTR97_012205 [Elasticomyces elasticus]
MSISFIAGTSDSGITPGSSPNRRVMAKIDVHHHVYPPVFTEALQRAGGDPSGWYVPEWTIEADHQICKAVGISTAILSVTAPGPSIEADPVQAAKLARACNEFCANVRDKQPDAYGFFASVPSLLDVEACLREIEYSLDGLKADGVILLSRYGDDNHYLGHPAFQPVWAALSARKALVFIHPTHPVDTHLVNTRLPQPMFDYPHETGRTAIDLITSGMLREHAVDCGTLPYLIDRVAGMLPNTPMSTGKSRNDILDEARMFYYDTALASSPMALQALRELLGKDGEDHILFGSDFPNAPTASIEYMTDQLNSSKAFDVGSLRGNALKLLPRLQSRES